LVALERGRAISARDYLSALDWPRVLGGALDAIFDRCDAIMTPAAPGPAPGSEATGSSAFNALWSLCGLPVVTLPLMLSSDRLPMGLQLIGRHGDDARLLRTARWLSVKLGVREGNLSDG
jgi:aspartyl-tRNA(Asn)/glutamyl-tRNA(Gln) amidotransferase subunit A